MSGPCCRRSTLGPLTLQTFGICFALGFLAAGALIARRLEELGKPRDWAYEMVFAALVGGLVGSRLDYVLQNWDSASRRPARERCSAGPGWSGSAALIGGAIA